MPLSANVRKSLAVNLERYEGRVPHLYRDSEGHVTVGIGHLVSNRNEMARLTMMTGRAGVPMQAATLKQKQDEFDTIAKLPANLEAHRYEKHTKLTMRDQDIDGLLHEHIDSFYGSLAGTYCKAKGYPKDFDSLPQNVQLALFDMIFNLGVTGLTRFAQFNKSIKDGDWKKAATQCKRLGVNVDRNEYVKKLLLATSNEA
jgi:GH24 family phage-related lysozyme (muramidase)